MAVFKVPSVLIQIDNNTYDLVLQNDINTKGFTQWFNFKVHNKKNNFVAKFNIVNLVKKLFIVVQGKITVQHRNEAFSSFRKELKKR